MIDDNGNELGPGSKFEFEGEVDESCKPELDKEVVFNEGEYIVYVPPGQRAVVRYEKVEEIP